MPMERFLLTVLALVALPTPIVGPGIDCFSGAKDKVEIADDCLNCFVLGYYYSNFFPPFYQLGCYITKGDGKIYRDKIKEDHAILEKERDPTMWLEYYECDKPLCNRPPIFTPFNRPIMMATFIGGMIVASMLGILLGLEHMVPNALS